MTSNDPIPLPVKLKASNLRPIAYRILSRKHGLHIKSNALEVLTQYISLHFGNQWKSAESMKLMETVAKEWKQKFQANTNIFIDGDNLEVILKEIDEKKKSTKTTNQQLEKKIDTLSGVEKSDDDTEDKAVSTQSQRNYLQIRDCYDLPIHKYNYTLRKFEPYLPSQDEINSKGTLTSRFKMNFNLQDKLDFFLRRYHLINDRVTRNESIHFAIEKGAEFNEIEYFRYITNSLDVYDDVKASNGAINKVTSVKNLLGRHGKQFIIFGLLIKDKAEQLSLRDPTDSITLDFSHAVKDESVFYFEGCFVFCDGVFTNFAGKTKFIVNVIYPPKVEERSAFYKTFGHLDFKSQNLDIISPAISEFNLKLEKHFDSTYKDELNINELEDFYGFQNSSIDKVILLGSNIHLDQAVTFEKLKTVFDALSEDPNTPLAIVFPGSFVSKSFEITLNSDSSTTSYKEMFDQLAFLISQYPKLCSHTHFVFVSGPYDPWESLVYQSSKAGQLPQCRLSDIFFSRMNRIVKNLRLVTNPFKFFYLNKEIAFMNDDFYERVLYNVLTFETESDDNEHEKVVKAGNKQRVASDLDSDNDESALNDALMEDALSIQELSISNKKKISSKSALKRDIFKLIDTILTQAHLSPFAPNIRPVTWKFDNLLSLNPLPNTLVMFDSSIEFFRYATHGVNVVNVGEFYNVIDSKATYVEFYPANEKIEVKKY